MQRERFTCCHALVGWVRHCSLYASPNLKQTIYTWPYLFDVHQLPIEKRRIPHNGNEFTSWSSALPLGWRLASTGRFILLKNKKMPAAAGKTSPSLAHPPKSNEPLSLANKRRLQPPGRPHQAYMTRTSRDAFFSKQRVLWQLGRPHQTYFIWENTRSAFVCKKKTPVAAGKTSPSI